MCEQQGLKGRIVGKDCATGKIHIKPDAGGEDVVMLPQDGPRGLGFDEDGRALPALLKGRVKYDVMEDYEGRRAVNVRWIESQGETEAPRE